MHGYFPITWKLVRKISGRQLGKDEVGDFTNPCCEITDFADSEAIIKSCWYWNINPFFFFIFFQKILNPSCFCLQTHYKRWKNQRQIFLVTHLYKIRQYMGGLPGQKIWTKWHFFVFLKIRHHRFSSFFPQNHP